MTDLHPNPESDALLQWVKDYPDMAADEIQRHRAPAQQVPSGFAVVPVEPTDKMLNAAQSRLCDIENNTYFNDYHQAEMFKAMVAAAPSTSPQQGQEATQQVREACAQVADRAAERDLEYAEKYPDEEAKMTNRAHRAMTIAASIRALILDEALPLQEGSAAGPVSPSATKGTAL